MLWVLHNLFDVPCHSHCAQGTLSEGAPWRWEHAKPQAPLQLLAFCVLPDAAAAPKSLLHLC